MDNYFLSAAQQQQDDQVERFEIAQLEISPDNFWADSCTTIQAAGRRQHDIHVSPRQLNFTGGG